MTGTDWGVPEIRLFDGSGRMLRDFFALDSPQVTSVAAGDLDADGRTEIVAGAGPGGPPRVTVFDRDGNAQRSFLAYAPAATGGVFVATADLDGDGRSDLVTGAAAGGSHVRTWDGRTGAALASFFAFDGVTRGGVSVAAADVDGDGRPEVIAGGGVDAGPLVRVFDRNGGFLRGFTAFDPALGGGVLVAAGDVDGDGRAEIVAGSRESGGPQVSLFDGTGAPRWSRSPFPGATTIAVGAGDLTGDGRAEVVAAASVGGAVIVRAYDSKGDELAVATGDVLWGDRVALAIGDVDRDGKPDLSLAASTSYGSELRTVATDGRVVTAFRPAAPLFAGGMRVAEGDVDGDGSLEVITAPGYGRRPEIRVFDDQGNLLYAYDAYDPVFRNGVYVAAGDVNGDGRAEVVVGPGYGESLVKVLDGRNGRTLSSFDAYETFEGGIRVAVADLNGNGEAEIVTGAGCCGGPHVQVFDGRGGRLGSFEAFDPASDAGVSVAAADVNGDGRDDIVVASEALQQVKVFDGFSFGQSVLASIPTPDLPAPRVGAGDVDGDGNAEIVAAGSWGGGVQVFRSDGSRMASFAPYDGFSGGLFVASALRPHGPVVRNAPPLAPIVRGPRSTAKRRPAYVFSAVDPDGQSSEIRFRCSFDRRQLHGCPKRYSQRLAVGRHVLRVQAFDGDGGASEVTRVAVIVRRR